MDVRIGVISSYVDKGIKAAIADLKRYLAQLAEAQKKAGGVGGVRGVSDDFAKLNPEFSEYLNSLGQSEEKTRTFWQQMQTLRSHIISVAVVLGTLTIAIKTVWEVFKQGAEVQQTADSFNYLIQKTGQSRDYLEQLRVASRGTISDLELMGDTLTIVAGTTGELQDKLLKATPELLEIAKAASKLNPTLGDTSYMFESITQGIKRQERRILDNLGIIVRLREANQRYADSMGIAVDAMTAEEIQQSFLNEALRVGRLLVEQAGNSTASAVDPYNRLTTAATNLYNIEAKRIQQGGAVDLLGRRLEQIVQTTRAVDALTAADQAGLLVDGQKIYILNNLRNGMADSAKVLEYLNELEAQRIALTIQYNQASESKLGTINAEGSIVSTLTNKYAGLSIEELKIAAVSEKVTAANLALNTATQEGADNLAELTLAAAQAEDALYQLQGGALAAARAQSILNAQLAGARAGFGGQFAGLVDGYTSRIAALNDQLAKAGGGGGGRPEKPIDMEEARLREAVAAGDLRDAYGDLNEVERKITEQEEMLTKARAEGADPAWIEYLEGSIQHLKDEQARANLAIYEKKKALQELTDILNGVVKAEDAYASSSGGAAGAAINLKEEIAKLNNELDKEITKMVVMAAVNRMLEDPTTESVNAALALGEAFGIVDATSAAAIKTATLLGEAWKAGVINDTELTTMTEGIITALEINVPRAALTAKGQIEQVVDADKATEARELMEETFADISERMLLTGTDAEITAGQIGAIAAVLSETAGDKGAFARHNIDTKKTLPEAVKDSIGALEELDLAFLKSNEEGSGLYWFRLAIQGLINKLAEMISKIQIAKGELGIGGTINTGTGEDGERATGGPVYRNRPYLVGERGPEMFMPSSNGQIIPNHQLVSGSRKRGRGNGGINVSGSLTINLEGVQDADALLESLRDALGVA